MQNADSRIQIRHLSVFHPTPHYIPTPLTYTQSHPYSLPSNKHKASNLHLKETEKKKEDP